jgi:hypothetical protein
MSEFDLEEIVYGMCCWCGRRLHRDEPVVDFGASLDLHGENLEKLLGCSVQIEKDGTVVTAVVCESGSDAKEAGDDVMFLACSEACGEFTIGFLEGLGSVPIAPLTEATVQAKLRP